MHTLIIFSDCTNMRNATTTTNSNDFVLNTTIFKECGADDVHLYTDNENQEDYKVNALYMRVAFSNELN